MAGKVTVRGMRLQHLFRFFELGNFQHEGRFQGTLPGHRPGGPAVSLNRSSFEEIIERVHTIPSLPEVVSQVSRLVNEPMANSSDVTQIMVKDAAMAAKMLRMVNSVYYGLSDPVHDMEQAVQILGFKTIRSIALSISVLNTFQQQNACFNMKAFWAHGAVSACLCRMIAERSKVCDPELAFTIGLLKGMGKLVLVESAPDETRAIVAVAREYKLSFHAAAREVLDTDDAEIGGWLAERWELEKVIVETIRNQYSLAAEQQTGPVAMCLFCEYLCALKKLRVSGECDEPTLDMGVWSHLGLDKNALVELLTRVNDEVDNARQLMALAS
jgi:HD-like signal output (HDOD) protein